MSEKKKKKKSKISLMIVIFLLPDTESMWINTKRQECFRNKWLIQSLCHSHYMSLKWQYFSVLYIKGRDFRGLLTLLCQVSISNSLQSLFNSHLKFSMQAFWKHIMCEQAAEQVI